MIAVRRLPRMVYRLVVDAGLSIPVTAEMDMCLECEGSWGRAMLRWFFMNWQLLFIIELGIICLAAGGISGCGDAPTQHLSETEFYMSPSGEALAAPLTELGRGYCAARDYAIANYSDVRDMYTDGGIQSFFCHFEMPVREAIWKQFPPGNGRLTPYWDYVPGELIPLEEAKAMRACEFCFETMPAFELFTEYQRGAHKYFRED